MARPLRIERAGAWYHTTARGTERRVIYTDDVDRRRWLGLLAEAAAMFNWLVHGYVMMDNHYHLIIQTREANLSQSMQWLQTSYSMGFNHRHGRVGPLFQGRFKAVVVDAPAWGWELSRYVHLNPVRTARMGLDKRARAVDRLGTRGKPDAQLVRERIVRLRKYRWSSYRAYVGLEKSPEWLNCAAVLSAAGHGSEKEHWQVYAQYVEQAVREGLPASPWEQVHAQLVLGGKQFLDKVRKAVAGSAREQPQQRALKRRPRWEEVLQTVQELKQEKWAAFRDRHGDWGRDLALYLGRREFGLSLRELGKAAGGVDYAAVSAAIKRFERRLAREHSLGKIVETMRLEMLNVET